MICFVGLLIIKVLFLGIEWFIGRNFIVNGFVEMVLGQVEVVFMVFLGCLWFIILCCVRLVVNVCV